MTYLPAPGEPVDHDQLASPRAQALVRVLVSGDISFVRFVECRRNGPDPAEIVVVDVEVELGQRTVHDIRPVERVGLVFPADDGLPEALALRADFPLVPHLNLRQEEFPRSLCLYELAWHEVKRQWTPLGMIERVRAWLALTAIGTLHAADQPLEPLLVGSYDTIVIPAEAETDAAVPLLLQEVNAGLGRRVLVTRLPTEASPFRSDGLAIAVRFVSRPRAHGVIVRNPATLNELHRFFADGGDDLLGDLRQRLLQLRKVLCRRRDFTHILSYPLILIAVLPKAREADDNVESIERRAFLCNRSVWEVGIDVGIWERGTADFGPTLRYEPLASKDGADTSLDLLDVVLELSPELAAGYNGVLSAQPLRVAAVGLGALGSQVFLNLVRMGWGRWSLIDCDYLLPHNLARHAAGGVDLGRPKAEAMADIANATIAGPPIARAIVADALDRQDTEVGTAFGEAEIILDTSASVAVARYLVRDVASAARRVSLFLNPTGTDAVLLAEDRARQLPLDLLEMQYYRGVATNPALTHHFRRTEGPIRYGGTCRDVSVLLSQNLVALHSAIGSRALRRALDREEATIEVWQVAAERSDVRSITISPTPVLEASGDDWTLCADRWLLDKIATLRGNKLPMETGGVLIGAFDTERRVVYAVDTIPAPPDSEEWPHLFIRGKTGLRERVNQISIRTDGMLGYVGEWHSHPDGFDCSPSEIDREAFEDLTATMRPDALPGLMFIACEDGRGTWCLGGIS